MKRQIWILLAVLIIVSMVAAQCGEEEPPPQVEETEEAVVEGGEEAEATEEAEEPAAKATEEAEEPAAPAAASTGPTYVHASGAFEMMQFGDVVQEDESTAVFSDGSSLVAVLFEKTPKELDGATLTEVANGALQAASDAGMISSFTSYPDEPESFGSGYIVYFDYASEQFGEGSSSMYVVKDGDNVYAVFLLTGDYAGMEETWVAIVQSFTPNPGGAVAGTGTEGEEAKEAEEAEEGGEVVTAAPTGELDTGFRPEANGFNFPNYGSEAGFTDMTPVEMERMFGSKVCASQAGGKCILTPPANQWMQQTNGYMAGGHCEGFAVLTILMYYGQADPTLFGSGSAHDLDIMGNDALQREIAYWWSTQTTWPAYAQSIEGPSACLDQLIETFKDGPKASETWRIGIMKEDGSGGHAITPFAIEDQGGGIYNVLVYDNNFPNETRILKIDKNSDTFEYEASINPQVESELYTGSNMMITAGSGRLAQQECSFCAGGGQSRVPGMAASRQEFYEIWLEGKADLLIEDEDGKRIGFVDGKFVNEIEGAEAQNLLFAGIDVWDVDNEPVYRVPVGKTFSITIDGSKLAQPESSAVTMIGPGYFLEVDDIWLEPEEMDMIGVTLDEGRHQITYVTDYSESPDIMIGVETDEADYAFLVQATEMIGEEDTFDVAIDLAENDFIINTSFNTDPVTFDIYTLRIDDEGESVFGSEDFVMNPENTLYMNYLTWEGDGSLMYLDMDYDNDGTIDESIELEDSGDEYFDWGEEEEEGMEEGEGEGEDEGIVEEEGEEGEEEGEEETVTQ